MTTREEKFKKVWSDPVLFIENFMQIKDRETGKLVKFKLNPMQKDFIKNMDNLGIILKARQGGMSTALCALAIYYAVTENYCNCLMLSYKEKSAREIFNKLKQLYKTLPEAIRPKLLKNNRQELELSNGSVISCGTMGTKDNGRGSTYKFIHISEYAFVKSDVAETQLNALEECLRNDGNLVIESTANGFNFYSDLYFKAKNKENTYKANFYNYIDTSCLYQQDYKKAMMMWERQNNKKWCEDELTEGEEQLLKIDGITLPMLCWRRVKISNKGLNNFNQEFPLTDNDAFITSGQSVFNNERINSVQIALKEQGQTYLNKKNCIDLPLELMNFYSKSFFIYKLPVENERYCLGVDVSEGIGSDYSVIQVYNKSTGEQVAEFYNNKIAPYQLADIVYQIGMYYNYALLCVEKASGGHTVIDKLRYDKGYLNMVKYKTYDERQKAQWKVGFDTNSKTKGIIINDLREWFDQGLIKVNSTKILDEMKIFEIKENGSMGASGTGHDDIVMATALCIVALKYNYWYVK